MRIRLASRNDLEGLSDVWLKTTDLDSSTPFRYLASRNDIYAKEFAKLARFKCAGYLNKCDFVTVYEVPQPTAKHCYVKPNMTVVAMACWNFVLPTESVGHHSVHGKVLQANVDEPTPDERAKFTNAPRANAFTSQCNKAKKSLSDSYPSGYLFLKVLYVLPEFQRRGIGRALTQWGLRIARLSCLPVALFASDAGRGLYASLGFRVVDQVPIRAEGDEDDGACLDVSVMVLDPAEVEQRTAMVVREAKERRLYVVAAVVLSGILQSGEGKKRVVSSIKKMHARRKALVLKA